MKKLIPIGIKLHSNKNVTVPNSKSPPAAADPPAESKNAVSVTVPDPDFYWKKSINVWSKTTTNYKPHTHRAC